MEFTAHSGKPRKRPHRESEQSEVMRFLFDQPLDQPAFLFRMVLLIIFAVITVRFLGSPIDPELVGGFWHLVNLPFHEAGHVIFGFLPQIGVSFMGTGMQLLMPIVCGATLLFKTGDSFGGAICLWWLGENFLDIAPYIGDASQGVLPLINGQIGQETPYGFHDWEFMLTELNIIQHDAAIALGSWNFGKVVMVFALAWGGIILWRAFQNRTWRE